MVQGEVSLPKRGYRVSVAEGQANARNHKIPTLRLKGRGEEATQQNPEVLSMTSLSCLPPFS